MSEIQDIASLVSALAAQLTATDSVLATAESCTGGWLAKVLTDRAGSSEWFAGGVVSYSNEAKQRLLGVDPAVIERDGAVSEATVREMAEGARARVGADLGVAVSGVAGPGGGTPNKPVGTVWIAWADADGTRAELFQFDGDRESVRWQSIQAALAGLLEA